MEALVVPRLRCRPATREGGAHLDPASIVRKGRSRHNPLGMPRSLLHVPLLPTLDAQGTRAPVRSPGRTNPLGARHIHPHIRGLSRSRSLRLSAQMFCRCPDYRYCEKEVWR
jgi:hypothetical protein